MTTTQPHDDGATAGRRAELDAARLLLDRTGIAPDDLIAASRPRTAVPTFVLYLPRVREERANAQLKSWKILRRIRSCPSRATPLVQAVTVLIQTH